MRRPLAFHVALLWLAAVPVAVAATRLDPTAAALAQAMSGHRVVLLGEVHDNAAQHALRIAALRQLIDQ